MTTPVQKKFLGLFNKKERWSLSWRGWLAAFLIFVLVAIFAVLNVQPFLAVTRRVDANYLVMEGWVHQYAARETVAEFRRGNYQKIFITGLPVEGSGEYGSDSDTEAYVGAGLLVRAGVAENLLQRVPRRKVDRDRTYGSAVALREWLAANGIKVARLNVVTESAHARRTQLLFQEAFGGATQIGVIAVRNPDYDPQHWWRYSEGVREVIGESIAYAYAEFLFSPQP